ncbi:MAG: chemotaxis protein CheA [Thermodesulfobacteriota bacterium]|nr:chemotaxis protein CheA [Thermodesulfobacteriota bacterium]
MTKKDQKLIKILNQIGEDIDSFSIGDTDEWKHIHGELEKVKKDLPKNKSKVTEILNLCLSGLERICQKTTDDFLSLVSAISEALIGSEKYIKDKKAGKPLLSESGKALKKILDEQSKNDRGSSPQTENKEKSEKLSLDEAAVALIQLEAGDDRGLNDLRECLEKMAADESYPESSRQYITDAAEKITMILKEGSTDADAAMEEVGDLLEEAMNVAGDYGREGNEKSVPAGSAVSAKKQGNDQGDAPQIKDEKHRAERTETEKPDSETEHKEHIERVGKTAGQKDDPQPAKEPEQDYMPEDADVELIAEFIAEGNDLFESAEEALLTLETDPDDLESVDKIFRAFHTVKGTSAFLELTLLAEMGHHAESLLSRVRDGEIRYSGGYADLSLRALDMLKGILRSVKDAIGGKPLLKPAGYDELMKVLKDPEAAGVSADEDVIDEPRVGDILVAQGKIEREELEKIADTCKDEKIGTQLIKSKAATAADVGQALRTQKKMKSGGRVVESSVRVGTRRLDRLIDMVGELVIAHSMVAQDELIVDGSNIELQKKVSLTSKIVRELQDISMSMRMVPLKSTFNKMARLVRDISRKIGKKVNFVTEGEDTEIDRNLVDVINDPLVHMVRNAVDHGIEPPEARKKNGKDETGVVKLTAYHSAGSVVVEISDDGKGLDRKALIAKAKEKGFISDSPDFNDNTLTDKEVFNMIFEPGFSTAEAVTDVSGRGVGMDVVRKNIESLRGQAEIKSELGKGSVFRMSLPLTLAIIDGMVVRVGNETYVIPTGSIIRSIKPDSKNITNVFEKGEMLSLQGELIPLINMSALYDIASTPKDEDMSLVVIVEDEEKQAGLLIDELIGRQQVVIKTLGGTMKSTPGISGGAIMPSGRVGLIIDVAGLLKFSNEVQEKEEGDGPGAAGTQVLAA